jgi:membrane associated rhomboid family serine protease
VFARDTFALHGQPAIQLDADGLRHPQSRRGDAQVFTRYEDLTHLAVSRRGLLLGTRHSAFAVLRNRFVDPQGPEAVMRALIARISLLPGGPEQIRRMAEVERGAREAQPARASFALIALCSAIFGLQCWLGSDVARAGEANWALVRDGDLWRIATGNLLHALGLPPHFALNMLALASLGPLVERSLGSARTLCVMALAGIAATLAGMQRDPHVVIGVSGVAFGLVGAVCWLELHRNHELPAWLRIPRRSILFLLLVNGALAALPFVSASAHVAGLAAGYAATALTARGAPSLRAPAPIWVRSLAHALVLLFTSSVAVAGWDLFVRADSGLRYTRRIAVLPGVASPLLHLRAVEVLEASDATRAELAAALAAEERAVEVTYRKQPEMLAVLADLRFRLGRTEQALAAIDEAIALAPEQERYRALRERILAGETRGRTPSEEVPPWLPSGARRAPAVSVEI